MNEPEEFVTIIMEGMKTHLRIGKSVDRDQVAVVGDLYGMTALLVEVTAAVAALRAHAEAEEPKEDPHGPS